MLFRSNADGFTRCESVLMGPRRDLAAKLAARGVEGDALRAALDEAEAAGEIDIAGFQRGTGGQVVLRDVTAGTLAAIGHAAGTTAGAGNVANVDAVTAAEAANLINSGPVGAVNGVAVVSDGQHTGATPGRAVRGPGWAGQKEHSE